MERHNQTARLHIDSLVLGLDNEKRMRTEERNEYQRQMRNKMDEASYM